MAGARAVVCPSPYESLSIVLLEGFALGTPGLVERALGRCSRTTAAARTPASSTRTATSTCEALDLLVRDASCLREALGANGRRYVDAEYRWDVVLDRWRAPAAPRSARG